tara:strand:- start:1224 stop:1466 length:243 start_codon:yes stop_codon:yes gene_type:complete
VNEYKNSKKNNKKYEFSINNILYFIMSYILLTIIFFFIFEKKFIKKINFDKIEKEHFEFNNELLRKIPENINTGFIPFDE